MLVYGASSSSSGLNWLLGLLGLAEKRAPISDHSSNIHPLLLLLFIFLAILIRLRLHLHHLAENIQPNSNASEVEIDQSLKAWEQEHPSGELDHYFDADQQLRHRTATHSGRVRRHGACAYCGNLCSTRCSRCKAARYCSAPCQIKHWMSGHKYDCFDTETAADEGPIHVHGASELAKKSERESSSNGSDGDGVKWSSDVGVDMSDGSDVSSLHGCEVCGKPSTTRCSRCKAVTYCSAKCLIVDWGWHKVHCIAGEVNSTPTKRSHGDVEVLKNSYEEEENVHSSGPLSLEFYPEGTTNFKSPIKGSKDPTKEAQEHRTEWARYFEDEVAKYRNEILLLQSERDQWMKRANFARERFHSLKKGSEQQLFVLKNEKDQSVSNAEKKACNMTHSLYKRLLNFQIAVQESIAEKRKLEEHIQMVESERAKVNNELQEEQKRVQCLAVECDKSHETAQIAIREVEVVRQELKQERERVQQLTEKFLRDVTYAESRAASAEEKLSDLHRKIRSTDYKVAVWTDSLGRPAMACAICLTNEKNVAFGCGHMTCRDCGSKLSKCPICREQITSYIRLFPG